MPRWYRKARIAGVALMAAGAVVLICSFPFIYGDPGSVAESQEPDPAWFAVVGGACTGSLAVGLLVLLAPSAHRLLARRAR